MMLVATAWLLCALIFIEYVARAPRSDDARMREGRPDELIDRSILPAALLGLVAIGVYMFGAGWYPLLRIQALASWASL